MITPHFIFVSILLVSTLFLPATAMAEKISRQEYDILQRVYQLMDKEHYADCLTTLVPLLKKKIPSSYAFSYAALCHASLDQELQALKILERGVTIYPEKPEFWHNIGLFQMQIEDFTGAVASYQNLLSLKQENDKDIYYNLAFAYYRLENYVDAMATLSNIIGTGEVKQHWLLLKMYCEVGQKDWDAAEQTGLKILAFAPQAANIWSLLGQLSVNRQNYVRATAYLEIANSLAPDLGRRDMVENLYGFQSAWNEQVRHKRLDGESHYDIAKKLSNSCQFQCALDELDRITGEDDMEINLLKGQLLFALGHNKEAVLQLLQIEKSPLTYHKMGGEKNLSNKEKRQHRDRLTARTFLLAGQILWLDHNWEEARDVFKKLELMTGYAELGKNLANCMQTLILEKKEIIEQPGLYDPPLFSESMINY